MRILLGLLLLRWRRKHLLDRHGSAFAPVDGGFVAHIAAQHLLVLEVLVAFDQLRRSTVARLVNRDHGYISGGHVSLVRRTTLDISQELLLSLNFIDHLAVNDLNIEIFTRYYQRVIPLVHIGKSVFPGALNSTTS